MDAARRRPHQSPRPTEPWNPDAVSWSLLGALTAIYQRRESLDPDSARTTLAHACLLLANILDTDSLTAWNDHPERTKDQVLWALTQAEAM